MADRLRDHGVRVPGLARLAMEDRKAQKGDGEKVDDKCMALEMALAPQFTYAQWVSRANQESRESAGKSGRSGKPGNTAWRLWASRINILSTWFWPGAGLHVIANHDGGLDQLGMLEWSSRPAKPSLQTVMTAFKQLTLTRHPTGTKEAGQGKEGQTLNLVLRPKS